MKKRLVFKKWVERILVWVFIISLILMVSVNDFNSLEGFIIWLSIIATVISSGALLSKYGRCLER